MDVLTVMGQPNQDTLGGTCAGYVWRIRENIDDLREGYRVAASILGCMKTYTCRHRELVVRMGSGQVVLGLEMPNTLKDQGKEIPEFMLKRFYRVLHMQNVPGGSKVGTGGGEGDVKSPKSCWRLRRTSSRVRRSWQTRW
jgi:hypothetical protein